MEKIKILKSISALLKKIFKFWKDDDSELIILVFFFKFLGLMFRQNYFPNIDYVKC